MALANFKTGSDHFKVVIDGEGLAHIIIAAKASGQVLEVVVRENSVVAQRSLPTQGSSPASIDAAFDENNRLHVLVGDEHWMYDGQAWRAAEPPPWRVLGVPVRSPRFVAGASHLIWSFNVHGETVGAPRRTAWHGIISIGGGIAWPWSSHGTRAVLVAQLPGGFGPWLVFEPEGKSETQLIGATTEADGTGARGLPAFTPRDVDQAWWTG